MKWGWCHRLNLTSEWKQYKTINLRNANKVIIHTQKWLYGNTIKVNLQLMLRKLSKKMEDLEWMGNKKCGSSLSMKMKIWIGMGQECFDEMAMA